MATTTFDTFTVTGEKMLLDVVWDTYNKTLQE
ncbi:predicted protein [Sclerotinia sclerotiorum 1980 UF-70]|uniref:Uncharacterized protein n=1 Tax=Sclerotinia sclerotiorum (strain ATCC 18683 / 1980 / Ss-1) TaxID=665079 RepID=A7EYP2_SCLS1|nr:predicted protein [Sclerotinia sclerotiorum 1980 UF-70]EDN94584.1 predicted protein [Sclerotinia sclerotiorum 1980 UF-70]